MHSCRTSTFIPAFLTLVAGVVGWGCGMEPGPESDEPALGTIEQGLRECPEDTCGSNSPKIETLGFHELNLQGLANPQGMRLVGAELNRTPVTFTVEKGRILARTGRLGARPIAGAQLVGLKIFLDASIADVVNRFALEVVGYRELPYPVPATSSDATGAYIVEYVDRTGVRKNLCSPRSGTFVDLPPDEALGMAPRELLFFEGDRFDTERMTIDKTVDNNWFNIGCAGHTLAKMHLTRNSTPSNAAGFGHSFDDRQATLKMFVADYCGTGKPFTVSGQPISWRDSAGVMEFYGTPFSLDARWTARGAACVREPRMLYPATEEGRQKFPDIWKQIRTECKIQLCQDVDFYSFDGKKRVSANRVF